MKCSLCKKEKTVSDFHKRRNRKRGYSSSCKECLYVRHGETMKTYAKKWAKGNVKYHRKSNLWRNYKMRLEDFDSMLKTQGGVCAVCKGPPLGKNSQFHIDHDHKTRKIRGLLCHFCNIALGMVRDDISHLKKLIEYLEIT